MRGGPELLASTQKAYFERRTTALPYLRLFQSIVSNDLSDVVQNADLSDWQEVFVVLCTFARPDEFNNLAEQLGQRLEFRYKVATKSENKAAANDAKTLRKDALLCYLAAGRLEKLVKIWADEMREEEEAEIAAKSSTDAGASRYSAHAAALQTFMEKIAVFNMATGYRDMDLAQPTQSEAAAESGARIYKLSLLYDRYFEYADILASQGLVSLAAQYVALTPADYKGADGSDTGLASARNRYVAARGSGGQTVAKPIVAPTVPAVPSSAVPSMPGPSNYGQPAYAPAPVAPVAAPGAYTPYTPAPGPAPAASSSTNPYGAAPSPYGVPAQGAANQGPYGASASAQQPGYGQQPTYGQSTPAFPAPPPMGRSRQADTGSPIIPASQRRDIPGWNDAPSIGAPLKRPTSASSGAKPMPIMSPFPEQQGQPMSPGVGPNGSAQSSFYNAPPRSGQAGPLPPPKATVGPPPRHAAPPQRSSSPRAGPPPPGRAGPPPGAIAGPPPQRAMSPLVPQEHRVLSPHMTMQPRPPSTNPYVQEQPPATTAASAGPYGPPSNGAPRAGPPPPSSRTASAAQVPQAPPPKAEAPKSKYRKCHEQRDDNTLVLTACPSSSSRRPQPHSASSATNLQRSEPRARSGQANNSGRHRDWLRPVCTTLI